MTSMTRFSLLITSALLLCSQPLFAAESAYIWQSQAQSTAPQNTAEAPKSGWSDVAQEVLINALSLTGIRYSYGGKSPETGFDCSGFVRYVFEQSASMTLPHGAKAISKLGEPVSTEQLQPGDLVFFNTLKTAFSHVGIYLGDNKFIHAPSSGGGIQVVNMKDSYWAKRFNGARRIDSDTVDASSSKNLGK